MNSLPRWLSRRGKKKKLEGGLDHDKHSLYSNVRKLIKLYTKIKVMKNY